MYSWIPTRDEHCTLECRVHCCCRQL